MVDGTLIVDDSVIFRDTIKSLLHTHYPDMNVTEAGTGDEAWQKLNEAQPQLVFSDIHIRNEQGLDLIRQIREQYPEVILVVFTGHDSQEYREAAYAKGADCYIPKRTASSLDILNLIDSVQAGEFPQWRLGMAHMQPQPPATAWKRAADSTRRD